MAKGHQRKSSSLSSTEFHGYEFLGPPGAFVISFGLPLVCYLALFLCNDKAGCPAPSVLHPSTLTLAQLKEEIGWPGFAGLLDLKVFLWVLGYYLWSLILKTVLPATEVEGVELTSGGKLKYGFNAFSSALVTLGIAGVGTLLQGVDFPLWSFIWDNQIQILTSNILIAYSLAIFVYVRSFTVKPRNKEKRELAAGGQSGNLLYDWFIGRELNPRITLPVFGAVDIKAFCELRPGMLGWVILNLTFIAHQYKAYGTITDSIILIVLFQSVYVFDALYMEPSILTTMDLTTDGFGVMLAFGDLVWLPHIYSLQARYLAMHPVSLGLLGILGVLTPQAIGYYIFRGANNEKHRFRTNPKDPQVSHLKYIETKTGSRLITTGWWGTARHINYLGDWIMAWSYCLPTGLAGFVVQRSSLLSGDNKEIVPGEARGWGMIFTYFYILYFAVLLVHRELRDEEKCHRKYGADWEAYQKKVPWKIIPYVY